MLTVTDALGFRSSNTTPVQVEPPSPVVTTSAQVTSITPTTATVGGSVNPAGEAMTYRFQYGTSPAHLDMVLYGLTVLLVGLTSLTVIRRRGLADNRECDDRECEVFLFFFAYALAAPRFKDYSYILLIPPSVHVVITVLRGTAAKVLAAALVCTHLFAYQSWVAALVLFTAYLAHLGRRARPLPEPPAAAPRPA